MLAAQADVERAVAEGRAREADAAKLAADRLADLKRRRVSHAEQAAAIKRQQQLADRAAKAEHQRQARRLLRFPLRHNQLERVSVRLSLPPGTTSRVGCRNRWWVDGVGLLVGMNLRMLGLAPTGALVVGRGASSKRYGVVTPGDSEEETRRISRQAAR